MKGGIIGSTQQRDTVNRWILTAHTRASIVSALKAKAECSASESQRVYSIAKIVGNSEWNEMRVMFINCLRLKIGRC